MKPYVTVVLSIICVMTAWTWASAADILENATEEYFDVECYDSTLSLNVEAAFLWQILSKLRDGCDIAITGLENRERDPVQSFFAEGEIEEVIKRLFRYLDVKNYVFEYTDISLTRISVFPESGWVSADPEHMSETPPPPEKKERNVGAVRVIGIIENTQAEYQEMAVGDLIVEYAGTRTYNSRDLIQAVQKTTPEDTVEMTAVRDGAISQYSLSGGLIGIKIKSDQVPESELGGYKSE